MGGLALSRVNFLVNEITHNLIKGLLTSNTIGEITMGFSMKPRKSLRTFVLSAISTTLLSSTFLITVPAQAASINIPNNTPGHLSTLQVKAAVKKLYKGRIIYTKRTATPGFPNCHVIKMITNTGEFKYIRYACTTD